MTANGREYYSLDEARAILGHLSDTDLLRLKKLAQYQALKSRDFDADTLLAEGVVRVLNGARHWPRGLEPGPFMLNVFGSIVSAAAKHDDYVEAFESNEEVDRDGLINSTSIQSEHCQESIPDQLHAQHMLTQLMEALANDQDSIAVAMGRAEGLTAQEVQDQFQLSAKRYDAARKRLQRAITSLTTKEATT